MAEQSDPDLAGPTPSARIAWDMCDREHSWDTTCYRCEALTAKIDRLVALERAAAEAERDAAIARAEAAETENARLREAAANVLPDAEVLDFYERQLAFDPCPVVPYYAEQWRKMLALRAALGATPPKETDAYTGTTQRLECNHVWTLYHNADYHDDPVGISEWYRRCNSCGTEENVPRESIVFESEIGHLHQEHNA